MGTSGNPGQQIHRRSGDRSDLAPLGGAPTARPGSSPGLGRARPTPRTGARMEEFEVDDPQVRGPRMSRSGGWWGIGFVAAVVITAAMVSLPTAASSGERIRVFYAVHAQLIVVQQILGILALIPFVG